MFLCYFIFIEKKAITDFVVRSWRSLIIITFVFYEKYIFTLV